MNSDITVRSLRPAMYYVIATIIGYLIGCFSTADTVSRFKHVNIHREGTGNPGASNVTFILGWKMGVLVGGTDILKGILATLLTTVITGSQSLGIFAGCGCILGHMFPVYLKFHGGKGFATLIGVLFGFDQKFCLLAVLFIFLITWITDYIVLATLNTAILFPVRAFDVNAATPALIFILAVVAVMFLKHWKNLNRIFIAKSGEKGFSLLFKKKAT